MFNTIDRNHLREFWYPTIGFAPTLSTSTIVDYAEIEVLPTGIKKLQQNLERYNVDSEFFEELNDPNNDYYEHIVAYVHFQHDTNIFNKLFLEVVDVNNSIELDPDILLTPAEKDIIIQVALESLEINKRNGYVLHY